jgi:hypothetical protein
MEGKARFIFPVIATAVIVFIASAAVTYTNIGIRFDFAQRWLFAFIVGWPVAAVTAFFVMPQIHRVTQLIVEWIEGKSL